MPTPPQPNPTPPNPTPGGDDLFVHQTAIITDGFRSLRDGEAVEFVVETSDDGRQKVGWAPFSRGARVCLGRAGRVVCSRAGSAQGCAPQHPHARLTTQPSPALPAPMLMPPPAPTPIRPST